MEQLEQLVGTVEQNSQNSGCSNGSGKSVETAKAEW